MKKRIKQKNVSQDFNSQKSSNSQNLENKQNNSKLYLGIGLGVLGGGLLGILVWVLRKDANDKS